jgi:hypothetical protein
MRRGIRERQFPTALSEAQQAQGRLAHCYGRGCQLLSWPAGAEFNFTSCEMVPYPEEQKAFDWNVPK